MVIYIIAYMVLVLLYLYTGTTNNMKLRAPNKIALSSAFLVASFIGFFTNDRFSYLSFDIVLLMAILFAFLGDIILLSSLTLGAFFFIGSNILFTVYQLVSLLEKGIAFSSFYFVFIIFIAFMGLLYILTKYVKRLNLGKMQYLVLIYLSSVTLSGTMGITTLAFFSSINYMVLISVGVILFMCSDYFLISERFLFKGNKTLHRINSLLYFTGMLLISLSTFF